MLADKFKSLRAAARRRGVAPLPATLQGVARDRVRDVLARLDRATRDQVDAVFALLDDVHPSAFSRPPQLARFCDGATTAHIACHVGILQRGSEKLDREGRDYWIKPLRELGVVESVTLGGDPPQFLPGHLKAKSPNSAYRLNAEFVEILKAKDGDWEKRLDAWSSQDAIRDRLRLQARAREEVRSQVDDDHVALIRAACDMYSRRFLPGFVVLYRDLGDGERVSEDDQKRMAEAGLKWTLEDPMPDVLLWNRTTDWLWVIEAVTSDGEVDTHKVAGLCRIATRFGKAGIGFTTAYRTWREAAARQRAHKNLAPGTRLWIQEDPAKELAVNSEPGGQ